MALQYLYAPSGYEPGKANGILPNITNADLGFVRGSSATRINGEGLIEDMGANVPRLDYTDGSCPTLLTEPERTNIAKYSENILSWSVNPSNWGGTRTSNALTSPDGSNSADLISVIQQSGVYMQFMNVTAGTTYSSSVYAKRISGTSTLKFALTSNFYGGTSTSEKGIFVDLSDGSIISNTIGEFANVKVIDVGNGWYRLFLEGHVARATGTATVTCYAQATSFMEYSIWGGQVEEGSFTSSYIANLSNSTTTRSADTRVISGDLSSYINSSEGVLEVKAKASFNGGRDVRISLSDRTTDNRLSLSWREAENRMSIFMNASGSNVFDGGTVGFKNFTLTHDQTEMTTFKIKWKSGDIQVKLNNTILLTQTDTFTMVGLDKVSLGKGYVGSSLFFEGNVQYIKVYDSVDDF